MDVLNLEQAFVFPLLPGRSQYSAALGRVDPGRCILGKLPDRFLRAATDYGYWVRRRGRIQNLRWCQAALERHAAAAHSGKVATHCKACQELQRRIAHARQK